ncbi:nitrate- and nitrite sensing domain-containing protein [Nocardia africana]
MNHRPERTDSTDSGGPAAPPPRTGPIGIGGVRARILTIALIPSVVLATAVAGVMSHLTGQARQDRQWVDVILQSVPHAVDFYDAILQERRLTLLRTAHRPFDVAMLTTERQRVDAAGSQLIAAVAQLSRAIPGSFDAFGTGFGNDVRQMTGLRTRVDADSASVDEVYQLYSRLTGAGAVAIDIMVQHAPNVASAVATAHTAALFRAADDMSAAHALAAATATDDGLDTRFLREFVRRIGAAHAEIDALGRADDPQLREQITDLTTAPAWQQLTTFEDSLISLGGSDREATGDLAPNRSGHEPPSMADRTVVQQHAEHVVQALRSLWRSYYEQVQRRAAHTADTTSHRAMLGGGIALLVAIAALVVSMWLANRLTQRLKRLRLQTLSRTDEQLPAIMARIRAGESVDVESALPALEFGHDEIGQVANAFDAAQRTAVSAAVTEAKTREAVNAVFLNLAHRSQLMAHRQLEVLDAAEASEEDPALMDLFFQLDHLATRERRNAENLIILGGERPGRQWRNPVPLRDVVRSAIAETQDYSRVQITRLPEVRINGGVVADIIHLLAELIDNATSFSPPASRVEASGSLVGKGTVVEIIDQGLGMPEHEIVRINALLGSGPDFSLMQLSSDSRLGLIVVSALANRNGIKVRLAESDYGGLKVVVLIPAAVLTDEPHSLAIDAAIAFDSTDPLPVDPPAHRTTGRNSLSPSGEAPRAAARQPVFNESQPPIAPSSTPQAVDHRPPLMAHDERPPLPRRRRQQSLAPELTMSTGTVDTPGRSATRERSAEQARDLMSAVAAGTREGRHRYPENTDDGERRP